MTRGPLLTAATDEERLARPDFTERLEALLVAGCGAVWLRSRTLGAGPLLDLARRVRARCDERAAELWIGDRVDVALASRADAVQLPERGLSVEGARRACGGRLSIGRSAHAAEAALAAALAGADRLVLGAIWGTPSHPGREPAGPPLLTRTREALRGAGLDTPILAIGGVTPERAPEALAAGADGVVAIRALWDADDPADAARRFLDALRRTRG